MPALRILTFVATFVPIPAFATGVPIEPPPELDVPGAVLLIAGLGLAGAVIRHRPVMVLLLNATLRLAEAIRNVLVRIFRTTRRDGPA